MSPLEWSEKQHIWQVVVPSLAQSHEFLMHSIMAFAALHLAHLRPSSRKKYSSIAFQHHDNAQSLYRSALMEASSANHLALFACSILVILFSLGLQFIPGLVESDDLLDNFINILRVLNSSTNIFGDARPWKGNGQRRDLTNTRSLDTTLKTHLSDSMRTVDSSNRPFKARGNVNISAVLDDLDAFNKAITDDQDLRTIYQRTIQNLRSYYSRVPNYPSDLSQVVGWPKSLGSEYLALLHQKQPMALIILAHWCVSVHRASHRWFMSRWAGKVTALIAYSINPDWKYILRWPLQEMEIVLGASGS
jgi:hypothetical protein